MRPILTADVGGTNTRLALVDPKSLRPMVIERFDTPASFEALAKQFLGRMKPSAVAISAAGPIDHRLHQVKLANSPLVIKHDKVKKELHCKVLLLNDWECLGYIVNCLSPKDCRLVKRGTSVPRGNRLMFGPGTGLGVVFTRYDAARKAYLPIASEAGHMPFGAADATELELFSKLKQRVGKLDIEVILCRVENLYAVATGKELPVQEAMRQRDAVSKRFFSLYAKILGRYTQALAMASISTGGIYLAGGVLQKNPWLLSKGFISSFLDSAYHQKLLADMPVYLIMSEEIVHTAAAYAVKVNR